MDRVLRFWAKVDKGLGDGCWVWTGWTDSSGYGNFSAERIGYRRVRVVGAHRFSWALANGPIPVGLMVLHRCDTPPCVNPAHLFLGTQADNIRDCVAKGRARSGTRGGTVRGEEVGSAKLTAQAVRELRRRYAAGGVSQRGLAREVGVSPPTIRSLLRGKTWRHVVGGTP